MIWLFGFAFVFGFNLQYMCS